MCCKAACVKVMEPKIFEATVKFTSVYGEGDADVEGALKPRWTASEFLRVSAKLTELRFGSSEVRNAW